MIRLRNVTAGYNKIKVIKNIDIIFEKGTITSIIGKNGCGKTTLLKTASNLLKPMAGDVILNDKDAWSNIYLMKNNQVAKRISCLPQNKDVPNITVYSLVMHGRFPYLNFARIPKENDKLIVDEAIEKMGIGKFKHKNIQELSGGERQKVYIAMVLAQDTDVIFFDEPSTYLDINHQLEILEIINELKKSGKTVVMVLHDLNGALSYSDKICLMDKGEIVIYDTPKAVIESKLINKVFNISCEEVCLKESKSKQYVFTLPGA